MASRNRRTEDQRHREDPMTIKHANRSVDEQTELRSEASQVERSEGPAPQPRPELRPELARF